MKARYALVIFLVAVLALVGVGCTGGGWFINDIPPGSPWPELDGNRITFGFNAQPAMDSTAKGQFQFVDHTSKTRIHGTFSGTIGFPSDNWSTFDGTCSINGTGDHELFI